MKKYYVRYPRNFANEYSLVWADSEHPMPDPEDNGWERITRKQAIYLAASEADRRKTDVNSSGYADDYIFPWWIEGTYEEIYHPKYGYGKAFRVHTEHRSEYDGLIMHESSRIIDLT